MNKKSTKNPSEQIDPPTSRRLALKTILGGAGAVAGSQALPENWIKPVISTVILPAHAGVSGGPPCSITQFETSNGDSVETAISGLAVEAGDAPDGSSANLVLTSEAEILSTQSEFFSAPFSGGDAAFEVIDVQWLGPQTSRELTATVTLESGGTCTDEISIPDPT